MNDVNRSIKVYIDSTEAGKNIEGLRAYIAKLEKDLNSLNKQDPAYAANAAKMQKSIESAYNQLGKYQKSVQEVDRVLNNLSGATYKELIAVQKKIERDLKNTARGTEEYNQKLEMHKKVSKEVALAQKEMRSELGSQASLWDRAKSWLTGSVVGFVSAAAAISGITAALSKYREERDKLESGQKELKALTGLDDQSITWLTENAKRLSGTMSKEGVRITQSAEQILEAYRIVGGEKPELLDNKEALASVTEEVLILAAASKMDLTEATRAVTLAMNQYSASAEEAARYTNVLAAGSKEGSAEVDSQAAAIKRAGVSAAAANIPIEQLVGSIQTLAEKGIKDEVAGTGLKKFFLTLQTGADDTNPKVVGLYTALDNLAKKQMQAADIKKMFGEEGYNVASVLINETEKVKAYTTAVTGTSVALEQAAINSDTAEARRAQRQNRLINQGISLLDKLAPSIEKVEEASATAAETLMNGAKWLLENGKLVASLIVTLGTYIAVVKISTAVREANTAASLKGIIVEKAQAIALRATIAAEYAASAAKLVLSGSIKAATVAMRGFLVTLGVNPIVAIGVAVAALTIGIYKLATRTNEAKESMKTFMSESIKEQTELNKLYDALKRTADGSSLRIKLIKEFNEKYGEYLPNLLSEKSTMQDIEKAYTDATKAMKENIAQRTLKESVDKIEEESLGRKVKQLQDVKDELSGMPATVVDDIISKIVRQVDVGVSKGFELESVFRGVISNIRKDYFGNDSSSLPAHLANQLKDYVEEVYKAARKIKSVKNELSPFIARPDEPTSLPEVEVVGNAPKNTGGAKQETEDLKKEFQKRLSALDNYITEKKARITQDFLDGKMMMEDYNTDMQALELENLNKKLEMQGLDADARKKIELEILEFKKRIMEKEFEEYLKNNEKKGREQKKEEEKEKKHLGKLNSELQSHLDEIEKKTQEEIEKKKARFEILSDFGADLGQIVGDALAGTEDSFAEIMGNILILGLDTLRQITTMAIAERTIRDIGTLGPLGIAKAAGEIALINAAFYAVKGLIKKPTTSGSSSASSSSSSDKKTGSRVTDGFSSGGYTGAGEVYDVAGVVHRGEYVVPAWQMNEPVSFNYVRALEGIRQTKQAEPSMPGYASGGMVDPSIQTAGNDLRPILTELIYLLRYLKDYGIDARMVYSQFIKVKDTIEKSKKIGSKG